MRALSFLVGKPGARITFCGPIHSVHNHYWPTGQQLHEIAFFEFCLKHLGGSRGRNLRTFLGGSDSFLQKVLKNFACFGADAWKTCEFLVRVLCEVFNPEYAMTSKGVSRSYSPILVYLLWRWIFLCAGRGCSLRLLHGDLIFDFLV